MNKHKEWCQASAIKIAKLHIDTGQKLGEYDSIYQASMEMGSSSKSGNISKAVNGELKTAYGYKWIKI